MEAKRFRMGSITVLFAVIALCVFIFGALTVAAAVSDLREAQRYGQYVSQLNQCQNAGQQWLAQVDAWQKGEGELPQGTVLENDQISAQLQQNDITLSVCLQLQEKGYSIIRWDCTARWQPETGLNLWQPETP